MTVTTPSAQGGKYSSYDTPWMITCSGVPISISGTLYVTSKLVLGSAPAGCSSLDGNTLTDTNNTGSIPGTLKAPTTWTWAAPGCFDIHFRQPISGKVGQTVAYNCFSNSDGTGDLLSTGNITVGLPVGVP